MRKKLTIMNKTHSLPLSQLYNERKNGRGIDDNANIPIVRFQGCIHHRSRFVGVCILHSVLPRVGCSLGCFFFVNPWFRVWTVFPGRGFWQIRRYVISADYFRSWSSCIGRCWSLVSMKKNHGVLCYITPSTSTNARPTDHHQSTKQKSKSKKKKSHENPEINTRQMKYERIHPC